MATILVVDDRAVNREFLTTLLGYRGHRVLEAGDGAEALEVLRTTRADLVISDILMPTMDGYELVRRMRQSPATANLPVMLFTAHYNEREARSLADFCGVARVLTKPASPEQVLKTVDELLFIKPLPPLSTPAPERFEQEHLVVVKDKLIEVTVELQRNSDHLAALIDMNLQLASERDPKKLLSGFCRAARDLVAAQYVVAAVRVGDQGPLRYVAMSGIAQHIATDLEKALLREGAFPDQSTDPRSSRRWLDDGDPTAIGLPVEHPPVHSLVVAPIRALVHNYGWVCATGKLGGGEFTEEDERLLAMFAAQVGRIYENGTLYADLKRRADELRQEVVDRKLAEAALVKSEESFRSLFRSSPLPMWVYSLTTLRFLEVNDAAIANYGYSREEFLKMTLKDIRLPEDVDMLLQRLPSLPTKQVPSVGWQHRSKDGRTMDVEIYVHDIEFERERARLTLIVDVTGRKATECQLRQAQKMEAVGQLTGGVAHDFNNILMVIMANVDALDEEEGFSPDLHDRVIQIGDATQRAADLTRQLLAFSRTQPLRPQRTNINDLVAVTRKLMGRTLGERIEIDAVLADDLWTTNIDRSQLETALVNLCINARDAMPKGGQLLIETQNVTLDGDYAANNGDAIAGDYAMLAVTDTGEGIPLDKLSKVFEPFFTTKEVGKGSGLGLSMIHGFTKQSHGHVQICSEVGRGTTVKMYLPRVRGEGEKAVVKTAASMPRGTERILVVEDEAPVLANVVGQLRSLGYSVAEAVNGTAALVHLEATTEPYNLLLTDMVMPGKIDGKALADQVKLRWPDMPIIFISGYIGNAVLQEGQLPADMRVLNKPFRKADLAVAVRGALDEGAMKPLIAA